LPDDDAVKRRGLDKFQRMTQPLTVGTLLINHGHRWSALTFLGDHDHMAETLAVVTLLNDHGHSWSALSFLGDHCHWLHHPPS
jgi:hypothetical protein